MGVADVAQLAGQFGLAGVLMAFLFWKERNDREDRRRREERQAQIDERDIEERGKLASALASLSMVIQGRGNV
jgi:Flp pilus assembly protein TadB